MSSKTILPAGVLCNTATGKFHPVFFRLSPAPSSDPLESAQRYKSSAHHTEGFGSLDEAKNFIAELVGYVDTQMVWDWDGNGIPIVTAWFSLSSTNKAPTTA